MKQNNTCSWLISATLSLGGAGCGQEGTNDTKSTTTTSQAVVVEAGSAFDFDGSDDYIDLGILVDINRAIAPSGRQFELYEPFDQTAFVVCLTADQKHALIQRGWAFAW